MRIRFRYLIKIDYNFDIKQYFLFRFFFEKRRYRR